MFPPYTCQVYAFRPNKTSLEWSAALPVPAPAARPRQPVNALQHAAKDRLRRDTYLHFFAVLSCQHPCSIMCGPSRLAASWLASNFVRPPDRPYPCAHCRSAAGPMVLRYLRTHGSPCQILSLVGCLPPSTAGTSEAATTRPKGRAASGVSSDHPVPFKAATQ
jgi:hypothetical protein